MKLVEAGIGDYKTVVSLDSRTVLKTLAWLQFRAEYDETWIELNKES